MQLKSLSHRTDLIFTSFDGEVHDRDSYMVVKTLSNPNYFWGNLLIYDCPPKKGDLKDWTERFKTELTDPRIYHMTFAWDSPEGEVGDVSEFQEAGFRLERGVALTASAVHLPVKYHPKLGVRPIQGDDEWEQSIQLQIACANETISKHSSRFPAPGGLRFPCF